MPKFVDLTGKTFNRLTALSCVPVKTENGKRTRINWRCRCVCGAESLVRGNALMSGATKSCGCLHTEVITTHGATRGGAMPRTYGNWVGMKSRCSSPSDPNWDRYGGRGITVCERWQDFANFLADMGEKPPGLSLERVDNNAGYSPDNCIWADHKTQCRNRRSTPFITLCGNRLPLMTACERYNVRYHAVWARKGRAECSMIEAFLHVLDREYAA